MTSSHHDIVPEFDAIRTERDVASWLYEHHNEAYGWFRDLYVHLKSVPSLSTLSSLEHCNESQNKALRTLDTMIANAPFESHARLSALGLAIRMGRFGFANRIAQRFSYLLVAKTKAFAHCLHQRLLDVNTHQGLCEEVFAVTKKWNMMIPVFNEIFFKRNRNTPLVALTTLKTELKTTPDLIERIRRHSLEGMKMVNLPAWHQMIVSHKETPENAIIFVNTIVEICQHVFWQAKERPESQKQILGFFDGDPHLLMGLMAGMPHDQFLACLHKNTTKQPAVFRELVSRHGFFRFRKHWRELETSEQHHLLRIVLSTMDKTLFGMSVTHIRKQWPELANLLGIEHNST